MWLYAALSRSYLPTMLTRPRTLPIGFIQPCLPVKALKPPTGAVWLHGI
jgi:hypothetical protein